MFIANPIYDVFFKYLMEDTALASRLISNIIGEEIVDLVVYPQETTLRVTNYYLSVIRLDFKATIRTDTGEFKKVLIELQKGNVAFDITRFRKYLGSNYTKADHVRDGAGKVLKSLPIIAIYFLGFELDNIFTPVVRASHYYYDVVQGQTLQVKNDFVEQLIHDCFVIQIPRLTNSMQSRLEKMLVIFNQTYIVEEDNRRLSVPDTWLQDAELKAFLQRLAYPLFDEAMQNQAEAEDELVEELDDLHRQLEQNKDEIEKKDKAIQEQAKLIAELQKKLGN